MASSDVRANKIEGYRDGNRITWQPKSERAVWKAREDSRLARTQRNAFEKQLRIELLESSFGNIVNAHRDTSRSYDQIAALGRFSDLIFQ